MRKAIIIIVVVVVVAILALIAYQQSRTAAVPEVRMVTVQRGAITKAVVATGEIRPLAEAEVKSRIGGVVRRFFAEEGDAVAKGQRLAEIVPTATPEELVYAREAVKTAKYRLDQSRRILNRLESLAEKDLVSDAEIDEAETQLSIDEARYDAALAELEVLEEGSAGAKATRDRTTASTASALGDMIIASPINGIVLSRNVDEGSSVIPLSSAYGGTSLMTLADVSSMHFEGDVDESDVAKISEGMATKVFVDAFPETVFTGVLTKIAPQGVMTEGVVNFSVEAEIDGDTSVLRTGMSADVQLVLEERTGVLTVPEGAVIYQADSTFVEVSDETAQGGRLRTPVEVGLSDGIRTEVIKGLEEGQTVLLQ